MALAIFDRGGNLRPECIAAPPGSATSVWHDGFGFTDVLLIDAVFVHPACRRQKIGQALIEAVLQKVCDTYGRIYAVAWPTLYWSGDMQHQVNDLSMSDLRLLRRQHTQASLAFFRALGFRRIGATRFLAWSSMSQRPSRQLAATDDYDPPNIDSV